MRTTPSSPDWITKRSLIVLILVGLFVLIFGITLFHGHRQFQSTLDNALITDRNLADMGAMILQEHERATLGILQSYASRPLFISSVRTKDVAGVHAHLADLEKNNKEMDLTFLTDPDGILWANYPVFPQALGTDLSSRDWYQKIHITWKPYVSTLFKLVVGNKPLAVAVCVPVLDEKGEVVGILANSHRLGFIDDIFKSLHMASKETIIVIDQAGHIIYSNKGSYAEQITDYPFHPNIEQALRQKKSRLEINIPHDGQDKRYLAISPLEDIGWAVIVERSLNDTVRSEYGHFVETATIAASLFVFVALFIVYQYSLYRKSEGLLQTELKLKQIDERYRDLLGNIPDVFYIYSNKQSGIFYSPQVESVLGYTAEYLIGNPTLWHDSIHPDDLAAVDQALANSTTGQRIELEYRIQDVHRQWHWFYDRSLSITNEAGETLISGLVSDITNQKVLQQKLDKVRHEQQIILGTVNIGIVLIVDRKQLWTNRKVIDLFQYSKEEMEGQTTRKLYPSQEAYEKVGEEAYPILAQGHTYETEQKLIRRDGTEIWVKYSGMAVEPPDMSKGTIWALEDITERKLDESKLKSALVEIQRFRKALDQISTYIYMKDTQSRYIYANRPTLELFGCSEEELVGSDDTRFFPPDTVTKLREIDSRVCMGEQTIEEIDIADAVGGRRVYWEVKTPLYAESDNKTILGLVGISTDITQRKQIEEALRASELRLSAAAKAANFGVYSYDLESGQAYYSPEFMAIYMDCRPTRIWNSMTIWFPRRFIPMTNPTF